MDSLLLTTFPDVVRPVCFCISSDGFWQNPNYSLVSANGLSCLLPLSSLQRPSLKLRTLSVTVAAKRDPNKKRPDSHSFVPRPDEATGPFPEAVLLKEKKVEKDGKLVPEFADAEEEALYESLSLQLESSLNLERMRHYEVVYLIHEDHKDEVESVNNKVQAEEFNMAALPVDPPAEFIQENKGRLWRFSDWGMRRLAYKIQKAKNAHYILMNFELEAKLINDFKSMLDKDERVIRHLVMKRDKAETEDCPPPPLFHSLRSDADEKDWEDDEFEDEDDGEDWIDEDGDEIDMSPFRDNTIGIISADDNANESNLNSVVKTKQKAEKVFR